MEQLTFASVRETLQALFPEAVALRRELHRCPELAFSEKATAARIRAWLTDCGIELLSAEPHTAVVGRVRGGFAGPVILVRQDIDALPMAEQTGLPFSSETEGVCHSCGHDIHTASLLLLAKALQQHRQGLHGTVLLAFQPAEETAAGAKAMFAAGFGQGDTAYDQVIGFHTEPSLTVGQIGIACGPCNASTDIVHLSVRSQGGHGAHPYRCADPVATAAYLITQLQTVISRENPALRPAVFTIGSIHGGTAENIIPTEVRMGGTLRSFDEDSRHNMWRSIQRITEHCCAAMRAEGTAEILEGVPVLYNDPKLCEILREAATKTLGAENVLDFPASPGSDDFSCFLEKAPGFQFRVGTSNDSPESRLGIHNPKNIFDEKAIQVGAEAMAAYILKEMGGAL